MKHSPIYTILAIVIFALLVSITVYFLVPYFRRKSLNSLVYGAIVQEVTISNNAVSDFVQKKAVADFVDCALKKHSRKEIEEAFANKKVQESSISDECYDKLMPMLSSSQIECFTKKMDNPLTSKQIFLLGNFKRRVLYGECYPLTCSPNPPLSRGEHTPGHVCNCDPLDGTCEDCGPENWKCAMYNDACQCFQTDNKYTP